jgi:hypothetical protein
MVKMAFHNNSAQSITWYMDKGRGGVEKGLLNPSTSIVTDFSAKIEKFGWLTAAFTGEVSFRCGGSSAPYAYDVYARPFQYYSSAAIPASDVTPAAPFAEWWNNNAMNAQWQYDQGKDLTIWGHLVAGGKIRKILPAPGVSWIGGCQVSGFSGLLLLNPKPLNGRNAQLTIEPKY